MADKKEEVKSELEKALDESLATLQKAASGDVETISKSAKKDEDEDAKGDKKLPPFMKKDEDKKDEDKKEDEDVKGKKDEEEIHGADSDLDKKDSKGDKKDDEDEDAKGKKDEEVDEEDEDKKKVGYRKSVEDTLAKSETVSNAIEVSKFLRDLVKSQSEVLGDVVYRMRRLEKSNAALGEALAKSQSAQNDMLKSMNEQVESFGAAPRPRKAISGPAETIAKSFRNDAPKAGDANELSKSEISSKLADLEMGSKVPYGTTARYETTGEMSKSVEKLVIGETKE